jgi:hypothetical protein
MGTACSFARRDVPVVWCFVRRARLCQRARSALIGWVVASCLGGLIISRSLGTRKALDAHAQNFCMVNGKWECRWQMCLRLIGGGPYIIVGSWEMPALYGGIFNAKTGRETGMTNLW